jgi:hypothetical protein
MSIDTLTRLTVRDFATRLGVTMTVRQTDRNPNMDDYRMDHWRCYLRCDSRRMSIVFSMGVGHRGKQPHVTDVLDCLASDAAGIVNSPRFEDWCGDYGYDSDSRKALRTFKTCERAAASLRRLLGSSAAFETLLFHTERL